MLLSLSILFKRPRRTYARYSENKFPGHSRELNQKEQDFIDRHLKKINDHQIVIQNQKKPLWLREGINLVITFSLSVATVLVLFVKYDLVMWLTGSIFGNDDPATFMLFQNPKVLTFVTYIIALLFSISLWPFVLQRILIKNKSEMLTFYLLVPSSVHKIGSEQFENELDTCRAVIGRNLSNLLKKRIVDQNRRYSVKELVHLTADHQSKDLNRIGLTTLAFIFLLFIMDLFSYVKVTPEKIIYSPAFSFEVIEKSFEDVKDAYYFCRRDDRKRYLQMRIELDNGYKIKVDGALIEDMFVVLDAANIPQGNIADQKAWCDNLK